MGELIGMNAAALFGMMTLVWLLSLALKDVSIIDSFWGLAFILVAAISHLTTEGWPPRSLLLLGLTTIWGLRLSLYLTWRNHGQPEDKRYAAMRDKHGSRFPLVSLFTVFWLQAALALIISAPLQVAQPAAAPAAWTAFDALGLALWLLGFAFEAGGDWQLARFKADPANKGKVLRSGFWGLTRHPNYFGDACLWWGIFAIACATPGGWKSAFAPALMSLFLVKVSGVAMLESYMVKEKGEEYADYVARTPAFIPWFPKPAAPQGD